MHYNDLFVLTKCNQAYQMIRGRSCRLDVLKRESRYSGLGLITREKVKLHEIKHKKLHWFSNT